MAGRQRGNFFKPLGSSLLRAIEVSRVEIVDMGVIGGVQLEVIDLVVGEIRRE